MLRCIRCGACMNHCPVYQKVGGHAYGWVYPGPMGSVLTPNYVGIQNAIDLPQAATFCNQCSVVCPVKIPLPDLMRKLREEQWQRGLRPWYEKIGMGIWAFAAKRPAVYGFAAKIAVQLLHLMGGRDRRIRSLPLGAGWTVSRDFPRPVAGPFASCIANVSLRVSPVHVRSAPLSGYPVERYKATESIRHATAARCVRQ